MLTRKQNPCPGREAKAGGIYMRTEAQVRYAEVISSRMRWACSAESQTGIKLPLNQT
jgi:hypothetical protein